MAHVDDAEAMAALIELYGLPPPPAPIITNYVYAVSGLAAKRAHRDMIKFLEVARQFYTGDVQIEERLDKKGGLQRNFYVLMQGTQKCDDFSPRWTKAVGAAMLLLPCAIHNAHLLGEGGCIDNAVALPDILTAPRDERFLSVQSVKESFLSAGIHFDRWYEQQFCGKVFYFMMEYELMQNTSKGGVKDDDARKRQATDSEGNKKERTTGGGGATPDGKVTIRLRGWWSKDGDEKDKEADMSVLSASHVKTLHKVRQGLKQDPPLLPPSTSKALHILGNEPPVDISGELVANFQGRWCLPFIFATLTGHPVKAIERCIFDKVRPCKRKRESKVEAPQASS